jgi:glucose/arabinose dehydrogenase
MRHCWMFMTLLATACGPSTPPTPAPGPGGGGTESITGRERIGWDQPAGDVVELATFRYAIYVDGVRADIADVSCGSTAAASGFPCTGRLPTMSSGAHTLELAAFTAGDGGSESPRSPSLRVVVAAAVAPIAATNWEGQLETTRDGIGLRAEKLIEGLDRPVDAAFAPDGSLFIAEHGGRVRAIADGKLQPSDALLLPEDDRGARQAALSLAVDPDFPRTHFVFVAHTGDSADGPVIRISRYRELHGVLAERAILFETPSEAAVDASAVARFGADGKLYVAVNGPAAAGRLFRLNPDGTMPRDQAGTTTAVATGIMAARGLDWDPRSGILWIADAEGAEAHLSGLSMSKPPVRAVVRGRRDVPPGTGSLAFYTSGILPALQGDAFIASSEGYILRLRFADDDPTRVARSERLLDQRAGPMRVVVIGPDGAVYFCTEHALGRLNGAN